MKLVKIIFWALVIVVILLTAVLFLAGGNRAAAATNISSTTPSYYAWNDADGWLNFYGSQTVTVYGTRVTGYATSSIGDLSLDCSTTRNGNICGVSNYGICNGTSATHNTDGSCSGADASGNLSGYAWNDTVGWVSFCGGNNTSQCPGVVKYGVTVDANGNFNGYAWNDDVGWVSFNCANTSSCGTANYLVSTSWRSTSTVGYLTSYIIDAGAPATLNSIVWQGSCGLAGTNLGFQIAASNSTSGPWNYLGPSGTNADWYGAPCSQSQTGGISASCPAPGTPICVNPTFFNNFRYFRYQVMLQSNLLQDSTPKVNNIILNFSK